MTMLQNKPHLIKIGGKKSFIKKQIISLILFLILLNISCDFSKTTVPTKLPNIPTNAQWYGGKDGGCWISITETKYPNQFYIQCFFDNTGEIWEEGVFQLDTTCTKKLLTIEEIKNEINGYFGSDFITLKNIISDGKYCTLLKIH